MATDTIAAADISNPDAATLRPRLALLALAAQPALARTLAGAGPLAGLLGPFLGKLLGDMQRKLAQTPDAELTSLISSLRRMLTDAGDSALTDDAYADRVEAYISELTEGRADAEYGRTADAASAADADGVPAAG